MKMPISIYNQYSYKIIKLSKYNIIYKIKKKGLYNIIYIYTYSYTYKYVVLTFNYVLK